MAVQESAQIESRSSPASGALHVPWGKLRKNLDGEVVDWLPLHDHCIDVASVFRALCRQPALGRSLKAALGRTLEAVDIERLAVLAFLHDLGKCNHGFQSKALANPSRTAGHVKELSALIFDEELSERFLQAINYAVLDSWFENPEDDPALRMLLASVSHHGRPIELDKSAVRIQRPLWLERDGIDPVSQIKSLASRAREIFPDAFACGAPRLDASPVLQHRFSGLVMLADWLGSHAEGFFPYHHGEGPRVEFAREAARRALRAVGLDVSGVRGQTSPDKKFAQLFSFRPQPTPLQDALFRACESPILIAESDTGSGKTEAALGHFFKLFCEGKVDSLYFALPTRVAARELYVRVLDFAKNAFGEDHPPVLLAVPGYARVDGEHALRTLPSEAHLWQDEATIRKLERGWASERPKRFLAAPIAVGTVDQALLSVMKVNHAHLRAVCLERALLVVDEVHASDSYMRGLLRALLAHHVQARGRALLLSATLGCDARSEFLAPINLLHEVPTLAEASSRAYPSITDARGRMTGIDTDPSRGKQVRIEPDPSLSTPARLIPRLREAVDAGARVIVVMNTVSRVMSLFRAVEQHPDLATALFSVHGISCPHHGRYARVDRSLLDEAASARLGRDSQAGPLLLIGSQTLEQSLDIDSDWLVTDLCPMDVLLQRIGRLHRHLRERPAGFGTARCTVLVPDFPNLDHYFDERGRVRGEAGIGKVYPDLRMTQLTLEKIGGGCEIRIPAQNRELVEWATHPENLARFQGGPWARHRNELLAISMAHGQAAQGALIVEKKPFGDPEVNFRALDERLSTRLGLDDRRIPLAEPLRGPFGRMIDEISIPGWMAKGVDATELDDPPEVDSSGLRFRYGGKVFRYTRLGLEFDDER